MTITCLLPVRKNPLLRGNLNPPYSRARDLTNTPRLRSDKSNICKVKKQIKTTLIKNLETNASWQRHQHRLSQISKIPPF